MNITIESPNANTIQVLDSVIRVTPRILTTKVEVKGVGLQGGTYIPTGGDADMILTKKSSSDYDMKWTNALEGITIDSSSNGGYF